MVREIHPKGAERKRLEAAFAAKFPDKRLLALQLDGFSHRVIYDDVPRSEKVHAFDVSFCMGAWEELGYARARGEDVCAQRLAREFLEEVGYSSHLKYQDHPVEVILVEPEDR